MLKLDENAPRLERRSVTSALWSAVGGYGNVFLSFVVFLILARLLTPDEFGLVAIATVFVDIILVIARGGLPEAVLQRPELDEDYADTAFWFSLLWGAVLCALLSLAAPFLAGLFGIAELSPVLMALSTVLFIMGAGTIHEARLQREFAFRKLAMRALLSNFLAGVIAIALALNGWGVWAMVVQRLIASVVTTCMNWIACGWIPRPRFVRAYVADQWSFGSRIFAANFLMGLNVRLQELIAATFLSTAAVGYIRLSWRCIDLVSQLAVIPLTSVALTSYARINAENKSLENAYFGFIRLSGIIAFPCFLGLAATAPVLIPVTFGENWAAAAPVTQLLCLTALPFVANSFVWPLLTAIRQGGKTLYLSFLQVVIGCGLGLAAAPFGLLPVTLAHVVRAYLTWPVALVSVRNSAGISIGGTLRTCMLPLIAAFTMAVLVSGLYWMMGERFSKPVTLCLLVSAGAVIYPALLFVTMPGDIRGVLKEARALFSRK
ncbi:MULTISPECIES: lipopolysaccharide biosynthesis protein [Agrobacterium]|uniref:Lipopolysaccharide biosynthesis protein n=1 Tax=Agrobacterium burrii TaxID=2815339 RepID=A0ABS3EE27_9HYPH|nr:MULTISPECIES: lipopolysaccharide biosynthesis protein [Agrobacterium]MBO0130208.1 lipopolysaccharide biosynthesis protein [Agrobacterium burrii]MQB10248.1 lipopolysaccharide biosynthesis protein [Agrobacterium sp. ICMP 6402]NTZ91245.1 lipopolysaccharide biosynthesis protein [Agrobacterium tumefaciens]